MNGFTASWIMQGSFKPPIVVNCVKSDSGSNQMIRKSGVFALSSLEAGQKDLAQKFFKPQRRVGNKFEEVDFYLGETGCSVHREGEPCDLRVQGVSTAVKDDWGTITI